MLAVGLVRQWPGLWKLNPSLGSDYQLADDYSLFLGIVLAGVPVSLFAFRIGSDIGPPLRGVATRGLLIHALPVAVAVTLIAFNFVGGVRMFWRPSLPIGPEFGLAWIGTTWGIKATVATLTVLTIAPLCAWLLWTRAAVGPLKQLNPAGIALFAGAVALAWMRVHSEEARFLQSFDTTWGWTLLALSSLYGCYRVVRDFVTRSAISRN